jgi:hypothetical protein
MVYLALQMTHGATPFGTTGKLLPLCANIVGKLFKTFFRGDDQLTDSSTRLKTSVDAYNTALSNVHARVSFKSYDLLKGISPQLVG